MHAVNTVASILTILFSETCLCNLRTAFTHLSVSLHRKDLGVTRNKVARAAAVRQLSVISSIITLGK